jgi:DNA-binding MarR family transcriptional regulator
VTPQRVSSDDGSAAGLAADPDLAAIGVQFGIFMRSAHRFAQGLHPQPATAPGPALEPAAYRVLGRIAGGGPARLSALAGDMCVDLSTVSRQVAALESVGLLRRTPDPHDRRASVIEATGAGIEAFARNRDRWLRALHELLADWTAAERHQFAVLLTRFNDAVLARTSGGTGSGGTGWEKR